VIGAAKTSPALFTVRNQSVEIEHHPSSNPKPTSCYSFAVARPFWGHGNTARRATWSTWLTVVALAMTSPASAIEDISIRPAGEAPVILIRPAPGDELVSGRESTIEWRAQRDLAAEGISEWEAFLSFDGGRTWPVRATPHLDISLSRFSFCIPMVASDDVRIMLRFGDEQREIGYVLPTVHRSVVASDTLLHPWASEPTLDLGETARPGVPGVVLWVDGARNGRRIVTRTAAWRSGAVSQAASARSSRWPFLTPPQPRAPELAERAGTWDISGRPHPNRGTLRAAQHALPLLLLLCRRNE